MWTHTLMTAFSSNWDFLSDKRAYGMLVRIAYGIKGAAFPVPTSEDESVPNDLLRRM